MSRRVSVLIFVTSMIMVSLPREAYAQPCVAGGEFVPTRSMSLGRASHVSERLADGRVLVAGNDGFTRHAELFDPATETIVPTGSLNVGRCYGCGSALLQDGNVFVVGGWSGGPVLTSSEIYETANGTFRPLVAQMTYNRLAPNTHLLSDGRVLVFGGHPGSGMWATAEIFDPVTETWSPTGSMSVPRLGASVMLSDGRVLVAGGMTSNGSYLASAEIYNAATGTFASTGSMSEGRHGLSLLLLQDGRVLMFGGLTNSGQRRKTVEIYDPASGTFSPGGEMAEARHAAGGLILPDGRVLTAGGSLDSGQTVASSEIYDPATQTFSPGPNMNVPRQWPNVTPLADGRFLLSGGYAPNGSRLASMEFYVPCSPDSTPPVLSVPASMTIEATGPHGALVTFAPSAVDDVDGPVAVSCSHESGATFPVGETTVTCIAVDATGNSDSDSFTITVVDTTAPVIADVVPSQSTLWAPDHKMRTVTIAVNASDNVSAVSCSIAGVTSNEPVNGTADGDMGSDWEITGPLTVNLRAERAGNGGGRVYTVAVECRDAVGNASSGSTSVSVSRDRR